jgi:hypothetical protein
MSSLSDLFPAGAGKQVSFTASGAISSGDTVVLNTNGSVSSVSGSTYTQSIGSDNTVASGSGSPVHAVVYSPDDDKIVVIYGLPGGTNSLMAVVGTISGTSISYGTPVTIDSSNVYNGQADACYDTNANKVIVTWGADDYPRYGKAAAGTISGTSISFGSEFNFKSDPNNSLGMCTCVFDATSNRTIVSYSYAGASNYGLITALSCTGSTISQPIGQTTYKSAVVSDSGISYDSAEGACVIAYNIGANNYPRYVAMTTSGSSFSFGSELAESSVLCNTNPTRIAYDASAQKHLGVWRRQSDNYAHLSSLSLSGTTITLSGTSTGISTVVFGDVRGATTYYDSSAEKCIVAQGNGSGIKVYPVDMSGSSPSAGTASTGTGTLSSYGHASTAVGTGKGVLAYRPSTNSGISSAVFQAGFIDSNYLSFLGIADGSISDTASGSVTIKGGVSTNVSGLTPNSDYYVQPNGSLSTTSSAVLAGRALSATSIDLDYST